MGYSSPYPHLDTANCFLCWPMSTLADADCQFVILAIWNAVALTVSSVTLLTGTLIGSERV